LPVQQPGSREEQAAGEQGGEEEQAHLGAGDLREQAEADDRSGQPDVGGEEDPGQRFGAVLGGGDRARSRDGSLEYEPARGAGDDRARDEHPEARFRQPDREREQAQSGEHGRDRGRQQLPRGA
jgi:hypothetical protein